MLSLLVKIIAASIIILSFKIGGNQCNQNVSYDFIRNLKSYQNFTRRSDPRELTSIKMYPYVVAILNSNRQPKCTGTIIDKKWVLTTAHCVTQDLEFVQYNTDELSPDLGKIQRIDKALIHPLFRDEAVKFSNKSDVIVLENDIGLLRTKEEMIVPINYTENVFNTEKEQINILREFGESGTVFGFEGSANKLTSGVLTHHNVTLTRCDHPDWQHAVCGKLSKSKNDPHHCAGDSGGPLVLRGEVVGLSSLRPSTCDPNNQQPDIVFTSVHSYVDLIRHQMQAFSDNNKMKLAAANSAIALHFNKIVVTLSSFSYFCLS